MLFKNIMTSIKVKGMHCEACEALIKMELEELGLEDEITGIDLRSDDIGVITFTHLSSSRKDQTIEAINLMEQYEVIPDGDSN